MTQQPLNPQPGKRKRKSARGLPAAVLESLRADRDNAYLVLAWRRPPPSLMMLLVEHEGTKAWIKNGTGHFVAEIASALTEHGVRGVIRKMGPLPGAPGWKPRLLKPADKPAGRFIGPVEYARRLKAAQTARQSVAPRSTAAASTAAGRDSPNRPSPSARSRAFGGNSKTVSKPKSQREMYMQTSAGASQAAIAGRRPSRRVEGSPNELDRNRPLNAQKLRAARSDMHARSLATILNVGAGVVAHDKTQGGYISL